METTNTTPTKAGKGLYVTGFVIALVALLLWIFISAAAALSAIAGGGMGLAMFWTILSAMGAALCVMGFMKAKSGNGKKGLAIAGLIIGLIATALSVRTIYAVKEVHAAMGDGGTEMINKMADGIKDLNNAVDSLQEKSEVTETANH